MAAVIPKGHFVWYDLMTPDPHGAIAFYTKLLGWGTEVWKGPMPYTMWTAHGKPHAGIMELPPDATKAGTPPHWIAYITTPDVDATAKQATSLGGRVLMPTMTIPEVGRFATMADPDGAVFAAYTPNQIPATIANEGMAAGPQHFSWHELNTRETTKAMAFYGALFGWQTSREMDMGADGQYVIYGHGGKDLGGMFSAAVRQGIPPSWLYYVQISDIHEALSQTKALGGHIYHGPEEVPGGALIAVCADPQGAHFALVTAPKA